MIALPKSLHFYQGDQLKPIESIKGFIKTGDKIKIELGYDRVLVTDFEGYVSRSPRPTIPYEIDCEDEMWQLKRKQVDVSLRDATVEQIIRAAAPGYEVNCTDEFYGDFSMLQSTPVKIFDELKKRAGLYTFFRNGVLVCGKVYSDENLPEVVANYKFGENVIESTLQFVESEDVKLKIYGTSKQPDGSVIRAEIGEDGGDIQRIESNVDFTKKQLENWIKNRYERVKASGGYDGQIESFGFPFVRHGQTIRVVDDIYEKRDTKHFADEIEVKVSPSGGYRRIIEVGKLIG